MKSEIIQNLKRGCGYLKKGAFYLRGGEFSEDGFIPTFVEFKKYILTRERQFRGYTLVNGLQFEQHIKPEVTFPLQYEEGMKKNMVRAGYKGEMETELQRHLIRIQFPGFRYSNINFQAINSINAFDLLMWIGEKYYPTPHDFINESRMLGISKRIPLQENPPVIWNLRTKIYFAHPKAVYSESLKEWLPAVIGFAYLQDLIYTKKTDKNPEWIENLQKIGRIKIVELTEDIDNTNGKIDDFEEAEE